MVQAVFHARVKAVRCTAAPQREVLQCSHGMQWCKPSMDLLSCALSCMT